jgi:hypothetical protein
MGISSIFLSDWDFIYSGVASPCGVDFGSVMGSCFWSLLLGVWGISSGWGFV